MHPVTPILAPRRRRSAAILLAAAAAVLSLAATVCGQDAPVTPDAAATQPSALPPLVAKGLDSNGSIALTLGQNRQITTSVPYKTVDVTDPEVVSAKLLGQTEILLTARRAGSAQLMLWDDAGRSVTADIVVDPDLRTIRAELARDLPDLKIQVSSANGALVLTGRVPSA